MRKVVAGTLVAAALAWTGGARAADDAKHGQPGSQSAATSPGRESGAGGTDRTSRDMRSDTRADETARAGAAHNEFEGKKNFDVSGKVRHASAQEVTIERKDGLPPATLHVGQGTKVEVDGKRASAAQLQPGQDVKASFNLNGGTAEAVELKAKKADEKDARKLHEQERDNQQERAKDARKNR